MEVICIKERWKEYPLNRNYFVSNYGRVKNRKGKILSLKKATNGYLFISASLNGKKETTLVHRMVMLTFCYDEEWNVKQVNHKNGVRDDNRLCNLEWVYSINNIDEKCINQRRLYELLQSAIRTVGYERTEEKLKELL